MARRRFSGACIRGAVWGAFFWIVLVAVLVAFDVIDTRLTIAGVLRIGVFGFVGGAVVAAAEGVVERTNRRGRRARQ